MVDLGSTAEMQGILLGKLKDDPDDDDKYSKYVAPSPKNHLNSHIIIYGASGSGKTRGIRTCIHNRRMPDGRGFFTSNKEIFRSHTDVWQGKPTQYGGKKTGQTVCSGCEYRFLSTQADGDAGQLCLLLFGKLPILEDQVNFIFLQHIF